MVGLLFFIGAGAGVGAGVGAGEKIPGAGAGYKWTGSATLQMMSQLLNLKLVSYYLPV